MQRNPGDRAGMEHKRKQESEQLIPVPRGLQSGACLRRPALSWNQWHASRGAFKNVGTYAPSFGALCAATFLTERERPRGKHAIGSREGQGVSSRLRTAAHAGLG